MDNPEKKKRLMIDLKTNYGIDHGHLGVGFKKAVIGYYVLLILLIVVGVYAMANVAIAKKAIQATKIEELGSMSQIRELQDLQAKTEVQVKETNQLIGWLQGEVHGQRLVKTLFSNMSKEVILEKFSLKRDGKNTHQVALAIDLKGGYRELHYEFEIMITKLEALGLKLISQNQSAINGGLRLQLICQMNVLKNNKR